MKHYHAPELEFERLFVRDVLTASGVTTVGPTNAADPTEPTSATDPTRATDPTMPAGNGIVLPEDTFG